MTTEDDGGSRVGAGGEDVSPSVAVVEAVAAEEDIPPETLDCILADVINPSALNALFASTVNGSRKTPGRIEFRYCGYDVTVRTDGSVEVWPVND